LPACPRERLPPPVFEKLPQHAYRTLLHRALLRALDYRGECGEYSSRAQPGRRFAEPLGGPVRDGRMAGRSLPALQWGPSSFGAAGRPVPPPPPPVADVTTITGADPRKNE
ncbi:MAG: hypothetical protein QME96_03020, partial [Myxococcota bacterium]|nr:hypothetical protein [Myxococcota bacterium]